MLIFIRNKQIHENGLAIPYKSIRKIPNNRQNFFINILFLGIKFLVLSQQKPRNIIFTLNDNHRFMVDSEVTRILANTQQFF